MTPNQLSTITTRQKIISVVVVVLSIFLIWQLIGLFGSGGSTPLASSPEKMTVNKTPVAPGQAAPPQQLTPQPAFFPQKPSVISQREIELLKLQQETEAKYIAAVNELQMLKLEREIAETNKAIVAAKLDTVTAQKNIVTLLTPAAPPPVAAGSYAQKLASPAAISVQQPLTQETTEANYSVVSVSQLQYRWSAVLGYQSRLYHVSVGDVLPPDGSTVLSINQSGIVLQKDGAKRKISLVPII